MTASSTLTIYVPVSLYSINCSSTVLHSFCILFSACSMENSFPATSAILMILSSWSMIPISRPVLRVKVSSGLSSCLISSLICSQWRSLIPGFLRAVIMGMYFMKSSIFVFVVWQFSAHLSRFFTVKDFAVLCKLLTEILTFLSTESGSSLMKTPFIHSFSQDFQAAAYFQRDWKGSNWDVTFCRWE